MATLRRSPLLMLFGALLIAAPVQAQDVDLELALLVDVSGSVDFNEYNLQKTGYVNAFNNPALWNAISNGAIGKIAVSYIEWGSSGQQATLAGWSIIDSEAAMNAFAADIQASSRAFQGSTAIGSAIQYGATSVINNQITSTRQVLDVSGDGCNNDGIAASAGRAFAVANGIDAINGLVIDPTTPCGGGVNLFQHYSNEVVTPSGFVQVATNFSDFETAVDQKIIREVTGTVPEPASMVLLATGLFGLGFVSRRRMSGKKSA